jgi:hypothetical protein
MIRYSCGAALRLLQIATIEREDLLTSAEV